MTDNITKIETPEIDLNKFSWRKTNLKTKIVFRFSKFYYSLKFWLIYKFGHIYWYIKDFGLYYYLFHIKFLRNKFKRIYWHHYLGRHHGKSIKWFNLNDRKSDKTL